MWMEIFGERVLFNSKIAARKILGEWTWVDKQMGLPIAEDEEYVDSVERYYLSIGLKWKESGKNGIWE